MYNKTIRTRMLLVTVCALSCVGRTEARWGVSTVSSWVWNSEPMKIVRCSSRGALCGAGIVAGYHAYYGGLQNNLSRVALGGLIGGAFGMLYSQFYGVQAGVRAMRKAIDALGKNVGELTKTVQNGFRNVQEQLNDLSTRVNSCVTFEALDNVKRELIALMDFHAQHQGHETRGKIEELKQQVQDIASQQTVVDQKLNEILRRLTLVRSQEVTVQVKG